MRKNIKLPFKLLLAMMLAIVLTISVGLSIWLITDRIEIKPELDVNKVITRYLDDLSADYLKDIVSLPSNSAVGLEPGSEELTYYYKMIKDSDGNDVSNLDENKNYALVEGQNGPKNAGTYSIKVEYLLTEDTNPDDNIDDSVVITEEVTFVINKAIINMEGISFAGEELTYDKNHHNIIISGTLPKDKNGNTLISDVVYTCGGNPFSGAIDAGIYNVTASFVYDEKNYETVNSMDATLKINEKALNLSTLTFKDNPNKIFYHTGNTIDEISSSLIVTDDDGAILKEGEDYTVKFSDVVNLGTDHKVTITGIKNYSGTSSTTYTIKEKVYNLIIKPNYQSGAAYEVVSYNGQIQRPSVTVTDEDNNILDGVSLSYDVDSKNKGTYKINVTATKEGYVTATKEITLLIQPINLTFTWSNNSFTYDKEEHIPTLVVDGILDIDKEDYKINLVSPQVNAGTYTAKAEINNTSGNYVLPNNDEYNFTISPRPVTFVSNSYGISYNSSYRTWNDIKSLAAKELTFNNVKDGDDVGATLIGMHNGIYSYGTVDGNNLDNSMTNVVGSTYQATVSLTNSNYTIIKNTFIFKYKTAIVNNGYYTIEDAINETGTITFAGDSANEKSYVSTCFTKLTYAQGNPYSKNYTYTLNNRKLIIPYIADQSASYTKVESSETTSYVYSALIIPNEVTLNLTGTSSLVVGAEIRFSQKDNSKNLPDTTLTGTHGVVMNNGIIDCSSGTNVYAYGYIKGAGNVYLRKGAVATDCIKTFDWVGGSALLEVYKYTFPSNAWIAHNISCSTYIYANAEYKIFIYAEVSVLTLEETAHLIGNSSSSNCVFKPSSTAGEDDCIIKSAKAADCWDENNENYAALNTIEGSNQIMGQKDVFNIKGDYNDATLKITKSALGFINVSLQSSKSISMPFGYADVVISEGSVLNLSNADYTCMPGSSITVNKGAVVNVGSGVDVAFLKWSDVSSYTDYLGGFGVLCVDKVDSKLICNGELNVSGNIGANILTSDEGALIKINGGTSASYTMITSPAEPRYVNSTTVNSTGNINLIENSQFSSGAYISSKNGDKYYWNQAANVKEFKFKFYKYNTTNPEKIGEKSVYVILESENAAYSYTFVGNEFSYSELHYDFVEWVDENGNSLAGKIYTDASEEISVYATWTEHEYEFSFTGGYDVDGIITDVTSDMNLSSGDEKTIKFKISEFDENGVYELPTASFSYDGVTKFFNNWYIGFADDHSESTINYITREQFNSIVEQYGATGPIPLYTEFADVSKISISIIDEKEHDVNIIPTGVINGETNSLVFVINGKTKLMDNNVSFTIEHNTIDTETYIDYYFEGFIIGEGTKVYSYDEVLNLIFESNTIIKVKWKSKLSITYSTGTQLNIDLGVIQNFVNTTYYYIANSQTDILLPTPNEQGHNFVGWTTSRVTNGTSTYSHNSTSINTSTFGTNITLYASYTVNTYTISISGSANQAVTVKLGSQSIISSNKGPSYSGSFTYGTKISITYSKAEWSWSSFSNLNTDYSLSYCSVEENKTNTITGRNDSRNGVDVSYYLGAGNVSLTFSKT